MAKSKTKFKIEIIVIELVLIAALLGVLFVKKVESYHFDSDATYFADGLDYSVPEGSVAKVDSKTKEISIERNNDATLPSNSIPVYYNNLSKMVLLEDMAIIKPLNGVVISNKLSYFTEIDIDNKNLVTLSRNDNQKYENEGILFDGIDTYVFLNDILIELGKDIRIKLPAFSFATVVKDKYIEYFNYQNKEFLIEYIDGLDVRARDIGDRFYINLNSDIVSFYSSDVMLNSFIQSYKPYFEVNEE